MVMAVMETPHRLAGSLRQNITQIQSPSNFVGKASPSSSEVFIAVHIQHTLFHRRGFTDVGRQIMEVLPELRMTAAYAPTIDDLLELLGVPGIFHGRDERRHLL